MNNGRLPSISVAMSVYNAEQFLASAINSILTQSFSDNWYLEDNLTFLQQIGLVP
jgi:glycosyltransferase involved in cell wall biosynthesis